MQNNRRHLFLYRVTTALFAAILGFCSLGTGLTAASADGPITLPVINTNESGPGSLLAAIQTANAVQDAFVISIEVDKPISTASVLPALEVIGRSGSIESNSGAVITGFTSEIGNGGRMTLKNTTIDNSAVNVAAINVINNYAESTLFLAGSNHILGNSSYPIILLAGKLTVDKVPDSSDMESTLVLDSASTAIFGRGPLVIEGGTLESQGAIQGVRVLNDIVITGGRLIATGGTAGIDTLTGIFVITGGTTVANGGLHDIASEISFLIDGGSVNARKFPGVKPTNKNGQDLYLVTVTVGETPIRNTEVSCSVNSGTAFACITDADGKLYLWMPEGTGAAEVSVGGSLYHARGTVATNYGNEMLALGDPVVTGVTVSPSSTTAVSGSAVQFSAHVEGLLDPPQTVTWKVENAHAGTAIDSTGLLTISAKESSETLHVTATSTYDLSKSGAAKVIVISAIGIVIGAIFILLLLLLFIAFSRILPSRRG